MHETSKDNPGCFHTALEYFSQLTGISTTKQLKKTEVELYTSKPKNAGPNWKKRLKYKSEQIQVVTPEGKELHYMQSGPKGWQRYSQYGIVADHFLVNVPRDLKEFGVEYQDAGWYKDSYTQSDGGGYCTIPLYRHNNFWFAPSMDCAHW